MGKTRKDEAERGAFRKAFGDVKPLKSKSPRRAMPPEDEDLRQAGRAAGSSTAGPIEPLLVEREANGIISAKRASTHRSIIDALEDPHREVEAECDLHGLTAREAEREVLRFVKDRQRRGQRWVRVIVGKGLHSASGKGTLRGHVVTALSQRAPARFVLAFRTAPQRLGGTGALIVRLVDRL